MEMTVIRSGMMTTVQDLGRIGHRAFGIPEGGALDGFALRIANLLVGNADGAPGLEFTLHGPELEFSADTLIAVCGAAFENFSAWKPVPVRAGQKLKFDSPVRGCRGYLAVAGGFDIRPVLGGSGTCLVGGFGGWNGRALRDGDQLPVAPASRRAELGWCIDSHLLPHYSNAPTVRIVRGDHAGEFKVGLQEQPFKVAAQSDRKALLLEGHRLDRTGGRELLSSAVYPGCVQIPPGGDPIVLLADGPTMGGYPLAGHVIRADLPILAQLRPGDTLAFREVTVGEAHQALKDRENRIALLRQGLSGKIASSA